MPSETFLRFLAQLQAEGPQKGDGFDASHFEGLTDAERASARRTLEEAALDGDDTAVHGLLLLVDPDVALPVLQRILSRRPFPDVAGARAAAALWRLTRDPAYVDALLAFVAHPDGTERLRALTALQGAPCSARMVRAMRDVILFDAGQTNRSYAARQLLYCAGLVDHPDDAFATQRETMRALRGTDVRVRREVLDRLHEDGRLRF